MHKSLCPFVIINRPPVGWKMVKNWSRKREKTAEIKLFNIINIADSGFRCENDMTWGEL